MTLNEQLKSPVCIKMNLSKHGRNIMENNIKIKEIWFDEVRIFIRDAVGAVYTRPLEAFPLLMEATETQR